jgi:carbonic anhydrase/acetyltransferase-like protein (isoleucine patch superfamily)
MLITRNGETPRVHPNAKIATSATIVGNVRIGARAYLDHHALVASSGPLVEVGAEAVVLAGAVLRSVGGTSRPAFPVRIGERTLVSPLCVLTGCQVGAGCYVATGATVLQGAAIGDHARIGAGAIVHAGTVLPGHSRVGMRHIAVPTAQGFLTTADVETARQAVAAADFFGFAFEATGTDQADLHEQVLSALLDEAHGWHDQPQA